MKNPLKMLVQALLILSFLFSLNSYANSINALFHQAGDPVTGNKNGKITIVEFFDYQCPNCVEMGPILTEIEKNNPDVRIVYKEFPFKGEASRYAARAALAANLQGKYKPFHYTLLKKGPILSDAIINDTAKEVGLDMQKWQQALNDKAQSERIDKQLNNVRNLAINLKVRGTPAFYIGKTNAKRMGEIKYYLGEMNQSDLQFQIDKLRK